MQRLRSSIRMSCTRPPLIRSSHRATAVIPGRFSRDRPRPKRQMGRHHSAVRLRQRPTTFRGTELARRIRCSPSWLRGPLHDRAAARRNDHNHCGRDDHHRRHHDHHDYSGDDHDEANDDDAWPNDNHGSGVGWRANDNGRWRDDDHYWHHRLRRCDHDNGSTADRNTAADGSTHTAGSAARRGVGAWRGTVRSAPSGRGVRHRPRQQPGSPRAAQPGPSANPVP